MANVTEIRVEEFRQLRMAILGFQREENAWPLALITATGVLVTIGLSQREPLILLAVPILAWLVLNRLEGLKHDVF